MLRDRAKRRMKERDRRLDRYQRIYDYLKGKTCADCPENDPRVLQFDHVRGVKTAGVSRMAKNKVSWPRILEEIEKCEIRCANCHARKTFIEGKFLSGVEITIPPTPAMECPNCWDTYEDCPVP